MAGKVDQSQATDRQRLQKLAESFCAAWQSAAVVDLQRFLPPPKDPFRPTALRHLVKLDLGIRWQRKQKYFLEAYLQTLPELGSPGALGADFLFEEYCVRQLCGDHPKLSDYQRRFPAQFKELERLLRDLPSQSRTPLVAVYNLGVKATLPEAPARTQANPPATRPPAQEGPAPTQAFNLAPKAPGATAAGTQAYAPPVTLPPGEAPTKVFDISPHPPPGSGEGKGGGPAPTQAFNLGPKTGPPSSSNPILLGGGLSNMAGPLSQAPKPPPSEALTLAPAVPATAPLHVPRSETVTEINGYKLEKRIGSGSFAEVWQGEAPGGFPVAIKRIMRPLDDDQAQRELQSLESVKKLRHMFLLQTHQYFLVDNHLYVVMELADCTLRDRMRQCQKQGLPGIPLPEVLRYFRESAEALDYMRSQHLFHRDIKPQNILIMNGHAKVADFGLAMLQESQRNLFTASGSGTPAYMAPEIWNRKVSPHSDQYSLAFAYAEQRLGRWAFTCQDLPGLMKAHLEADPDLGELPSVEQAIIRKALAKDPEKRYPSCLDFVAALEEALADQLGRSYSVRLPAGAGGPNSAEFGSTRASMAGNTSAVSSPTAATVLTPGTLAPYVARSRLNTILLGILMLLLVAGGSSWLALEYFRNQQKGAPSTEDPSGLAVVPASRTVGAGSVVTLTISAKRQQAGAPIELSFSGLPTGCEVDKNRTLPATDDSAEVKLLIAPDAKPVSGHPITIKGSIDGSPRELVFKLSIGPPVYQLPPDWKPTKGAELRDCDNRAYYEWIEVKGVPFRLIPQNRGNKEVSEPATFYMMQDKVWVGLFKEFAAKAAQPLQTKDWEKLKENKDQEFPVVIELDDADQFAAWLGGKLPSVGQWDKAAGRYDPEPGRLGPFEEPFEKNEIGIGRPSPLRRGESRKDKSHFGIRDLAGNGREWTSQIFDETGNIARRLPRPIKLQPGDTIVVRGQMFDAKKPLHFSDLQKTPQTYIPGVSTNRDYAFRVVIEP